VYFVIVFSQGHCFKTKFTSGKAFWISLIKNYSVNLKVKSCLEAVFSLSAKKRAQQYIKITRYLKIDFRPFGVPCTESKFVLRPLYLPGTKIVFLVRFKTAVLKHQ